MHRSVLCLAAMLMPLSVGPPALAMSEPQAGYAQNPLGEPQQLAQVSSENAENAGADASAEEELGHDLFQLVEAAVLFRTGARPFGADRAAFNKAMAEVEALVLAPPPTLPYAKVAAGYGMRVLTEPLIGSVEGQEEERLLAFVPKLMDASTFEEMNAVTRDFADTVFREYYFYNRAGGLSLKTR